MKSRIRMIREAKGLTQPEFAKAIGVSHSAEQKWEQGINVPAETTLRTICSTFDVDPVWLRTGEGEGPFITEGNSSLNWVNKIMRNKNPFARNLFRQFAELDDSDWEALRKIVNMLADKNEETADKVTGAKKEED